MNMSKLLQTSLGAVWWCLAIRPHYQSRANFPWQTRPNMKFGGVCKQKFASVDWALANTMLGTGALCFRRRDFARWPPLLPRFRFFGLVWRLEAESELSHSRISLVFSELEGENDTLEAGRNAVDPSLEYCTGIENVLVKEAIKWAKLWDIEATCRHQSAPSYCLKCHPRAALRFLVLFERTEFLSWENWLFPLKQLTSSLGGLDFLH